MDELSPEQMAVLRTAHPEELKFIITFARHYVGGQKFLCWFYRAVVAVGMVAGAIVSVVLLLSQLKVRL